MTCPTGLSVTVNAGGERSGDDDNTVDSRLLEPSREIEKRFKLSEVRVIASSKKIAEIKVKNSFYCTVNILITFNCRNVK